MSPDFTCTARTVPSRSTRSCVSIFIASIDTSGSPAFTTWPGLTDTVTTMPGMGAGTCDGLAGSACARRCAGLAPAFSMRMVRGWPLSSKNIFTTPSSSDGALPCMRITSVLPASMSIATSSRSPMP